MDDDTPVEFNGEIYTVGMLKQMQQEQLDSIYSTMAKMRDDWVQARASSGIEDRWRKNQELFDGTDTSDDDQSMMSVAKNGPSARRPQQVRSRVSINIVRPKVEQAVARMCEILLPTDDQNWEIRPTPLPDVVSRRVGNQAPTVDPATGQPTGLTADQEANAVKRAAQEACDAMGKRIADSLVECDFNGESRKGIFDGVLLGTMVLWGPKPTSKSCKSWAVGADGGSQLSIEQRMTPATEAVSPWDIWFDPSCGGNHQDGRGVWRKKLVNRKQLRSLVSKDGYDAEAIRKVLAQTPMNTRCIGGKISKTESRDDVYELWEYHGEVEPDDFSALSSVTGDPIDDVEQGVILMVNEAVIAAMPSWSPDCSLPCDVWCWRKDVNSPYGHGQPEELEHQQRVITAAWRMVMDNARASGGSQIVMKKNMIQPADGSRDYTISPMKVWAATSDVEDVRQAFTVVDFPSRLQELMAIMDKAMMFADMETSMPQLLNGNQGTGPTPETVGGMVMLYNSANTVLRLKVKLYDDCITRPHIGRYYDYLMANDDDPKIKGDYEIDARGASALIERDIQNQATLNLAQVTADPRFAPLMKDDMVLKSILKAFKFNPEAVMKSEDELKQMQENQQPAPPDPKIVSAEMNMEAKKMDIQDRQADREMEFQLRQEDNQLKREQLAYNAERERAQGEQQARQADQQAEIAIIKMQQDGSESQEERASRERLQAMQIDSKHQLFNAEAALRVRTGEGI